jgi:ubiquinone/menaquinone biosynthesis C-methylase UbiE
MMAAEYQTVEKALAYLAAADSIRERTHGERMVVDLLPSGVKRVLDLGTGDGRLLSIVQIAHPEIQGIGVDFSPTMIERARERFAHDANIQIIAHDFNDPIVGLGTFDAVVSCFAIHHVEDPRKQALYGEIFSMLSPGGVFINLEHVSSPTEKLHDEFLTAMGLTRTTEDRSNRCSPIATQIQWLEQIGFIDVDCFWKWRELAVLAGAKPAVDQIAI